MCFASLFIIAICVFFQKIEELQHQNEQMRERLMAVDKEVCMSNSLCSHFVDY